MSNIALDNNSSDIKTSSVTEKMKSVFEDLRMNRPKPLTDSSDFKCLVPRRPYVSMSNIAAFSNTAAKAPEVRWKSTPNLMLLVTDDNRTIVPKPWTDSSDVKCLVPCRRCVSMPNITVSKNSEAEAPEVGLKSDFRSLMANRRCVSMPNIAVSKNSEADAPEIGLNSVTSCCRTKLPVSTRFAESTAATLMPAPVIVEVGSIDCRSSPHVREVEEANVWQLTQNTDSAGTDPAVIPVKQRRPRRSFWNRAKKLVKRMFCCCCTVDFIDP